MRNIYSRLANFIESGISISLATIVDTRGSAPQVPGSSAIFSKGGLLYGTIGGGAVEAETGKLTSDQGGKTGIYTFNLANSISDKESPVCGGVISILIDDSPHKSLNVFREIRSSLENHQGGILVTVIKKSRKTKLMRYWVTSPDNKNLPEDILNAARNAIHGMLMSIDIEGCRKFELSDDKVIFLEPVIPSPRLIIAGAGHIGRSLSHISYFAGFEVTVIDDRPEHANNLNIPEANILTGDIGQTIRSMQLQPGSFIVIVTRGHKDDAEALKACIGKDVAYIGMIGSRKKTAAMKEDFIQNGWATEEQWSSIHTPVGLDINSRTVEEIAVSIAAEIIMVKNSRTGKRKSCPA